MDIYAYTLTVRNQQPIMGMGTIEDMKSFIIQMELPGAAPPEWIITHPTMRDNATDAVTYIHDKNGSSEWRLRWVRFA